MRGPEWTLGWWGCGPHLAPWVLSTRTGSPLPWWRVKYPCASHELVAWARVSQCPYPADLSPPSCSRPMSNRRPPFPSLCRNKGRTIFHSFFFKKNSSSISYYSTRITAIKAGKIWHVLIDWAMQKWQTMWWDGILGLGIELEIIAV